MNIWLISGLVSIIPAIITLWIGIKKIWWFSIISTIFLFGICMAIPVGIYQPISLRQERNRQLKEKQQIEYQIEHLTEDKDKIKLNEWILTYNDWVNDINAEKETYGVFSWHYNFDMTEFQIIDLV